MMPHISAIFLLLQSLEYLIEASWSIVVPHRFTVSLGRRMQPTALVWHRNGHCDFALGECLVPLRGHSLQGTISWDLQWLNTGGCPVHAPSPLHRPSHSAEDAAHSDTGFYQLLQLGPQRCWGVVGTLYSPISTVWKIGSGNYMAKWSQIAAYAFLLGSTRLEATALSTTPVNSQPY